MERMEVFGEQLDDLDQYVQVDKENIQNQMEEMEAKIHHQINDQYSDLQEAIEGLYLRVRYGHVAQSIVGGCQRGGYFISDGYDGRNVSARLLWA